MRVVGIHVQALAGALAELAESVFAQTADLAQQRRFGDDPADADFLAVAGAAQHGQPGDFAFQHVAFDGGDQRFWRIGGGVRLAPDGVQRFAHAGDLRIGVAFGLDRHQAADAQADAALRALEHLPRQQRGAGRLEQRQRRFFMVAFRSSGPRPQRRGRRVKTPAGGGAQGCAPFPELQDAASENSRRLRGPFA